MATTRVDLKETILIAHLELEAITHAAVAKSVIYVRYETRSVTFSVWYPALGHTVDEYDESDGEFSSILRCEKAKNGGPI